MTLKADQGHWSLAKAQFNRPHITSSYWSVINCLSRIVW